MIIQQQKYTYEELLQQNYQQAEIIKAQAKQLAELKLLEAKYFEQQHQLDQLKRMIFGSRSERFVPAINPNQTTLDLAIEPAASVELKQTQVASYTKTEVTKKANHKGRLALPENLPRNEIILQPEENVEGLKVIGKEITEELDYTPGKLFVNKYVRIKYAKPEGEGVIIAPMPDRVIDKCIAGPGLLANILVEKYVDHLPLHRQLHRYKREGIHIAASTINDWVKQTATLLLPLAEALKKEVMHAGYIMADESPIKVLDQNKESGIHQGYYWVYRAPIKRLVLFDYQRGRGKDGPKELLKDFKGKLQTDGYTVYEMFENHPHIIMFGCMAHARRYFEQALESDKARAAHVLELFSMLYDVERKAREQNNSHDERLKLRQAESIAVLNQLETWLKKNLTEVIPQSPIGKAITYSLARWEKLKRYTTDGKIEIDNNQVENSIRPLALGRKNYLFAGSHDAAKRAAAIYSLLGTCKLNNINPYTWLKDTLPKINSCKSNALINLLPR